MASHRQESKIYFICSHVKRQSLYKLQSTNVGYKRELYFSFLFLGWRKSLFEGRCWSPSSYFVVNDVLTSWKGLISSLYICITILTHQKKKKKNWPMSHSPLFYILVNCKTIMTLWLSFTFSPPFSFHQENLPPKERSLKHSPYVWPCKK